MTHIGETLTSAYAHDLGVPFDIVWECLGFRDWFDFVETGEE
jgi:hypothetical protein